MVVPPYPRNLILDMQACQWFLLLLERNAPSTFSHAPASNRGRPPRGWSKRRPTPGPEHFDAAFLIQIERQALKADLTGKITAFVFKDDKEELDVTEPRGEGDSYLLSPFVLRWIAVTYFIGI